MSITVVGGLSIRYRRLRPWWQCFFPIPLISDGYKYILLENYPIQTECIPPKREKVEVVIDGYRYLDLDGNGLLNIYNLYQWDGCSGPTADFENTMRGGLVHDALYQLLRAKLLPMNPNKEIADRLLEKCLIENGCYAWKARAFYNAVHVFGGWGMGSSEPMKESTTTAPK